MALFVDYMDTLDGDPNANPIPVGPLCSSSQQRPVLLPRAAAIAPTARGRVCRVGGLPLRLRPGSSLFPVVRSRVHCPRQRLARDRRWPPSSSRSFTSRPRRLAAPLPRAHRARSGPPCTPRRFSRRTSRKSRSGWASPTPSTSRGYLSECTGLRPPRFSACTSARRRAMVDAEGYGQLRKLADSGKLRPRVRN